MTLILADADHERKFPRQRLNVNGGWLRIGVRGLDNGPHSGYSDLRVLLVADVLRRVVEDLHTGHVQLAAVKPSKAAEDHRLRLALPFTPEMFNIRPSLGVEDFLDPTAELRSQGCEVIVEPTTAAKVNTPHFVQSNPQLTLRVGAVTEPVPAQDREPLAIRLALLRHLRGEPVSLETATLDQAEQTLGAWRRSVAAWAEHPSAPMHPATVEAARAALDDNLDVPAVLGLLTQLIDNRAVPPGAKFETFVFLDHVLALDLARDVGQPLSE